MNSRPFFRERRANGLMKSDSIGILKAGLSTGQKLLGLEEAPETILNSPFYDAIIQYGFRPSIFDITKNDSNSRFSNLFYRKPNRSQKLKKYLDLYKTALEMNSQTDLSIYLGGDHSVSASTIFAQLERFPELRVVWVDAHPDINTKETSPSQNLHGMVVSELMGLSSSSIFFKYFESSMKLDSSHIVYIGLRDIDPGELMYLEKLGIRYYTSNDVFRNGMDSIIRDAILYLDHEQSKPLHLSFDLDSVDPSIASATGIPVHGGLRLEDVKRLGDAIGGSGRMVSMDLVELNPSLASDQNELKKSIHVFTTLLKSILSAYRFSKIQSPFLRSTWRSQGVSDVLRIRD